MKIVSIHPFSALSGAALLGLVFVATGARQVPGSVQRIPARPAGEFRIAGVPTPQQMMRIEEGQPFTVPQGKLFVATGLGMNTEGGPVLTLSVDGIPAVVLRMETSSGLPSMRALPPGLAAPAGSVISVAGGGGLSARAWGYLADA